MTHDSEATMRHLGNVLDMLRDLLPTHRTKDLEDALAFYNARNPEAKIVPYGDYISVITSIGPLDWPGLRHPEAP